MMPSASDCRKIQLQKISCNLHKKSYHINIIWTLLYCGAKIVNYYELCAVS